MNPLHCIIAQVLSSTPNVYFIYRASSWSISNSDLQSVFKTRHKQISGLSARFEKHTVSSGRERLTIPRRQLCITRSARRLHQTQMNAG
ncbi:hypothetical protein E2C01_039546 [Portunus trituberculatus]|uniref:Uncharacterized protein n=1 Tax=Portunus trituberculatus TaxID=210409 RepID=A0A5B7FDX1_PORTR|nr:hypothetical protein [Portunus trituberculatus]